MAKCKNKHCKMSLFYHCMLHQMFKLGIHQNMLTFYYQIQFISNVGVVNQYIRTLLKKLPVSINQLPGFSLMCVPLKTVLLKLQNEWIYQDMETTLFQTEVPFILKKTFI